MYEKDSTIDKEIQKQNKEFVRALLNTDPDDRVDASQALEHGWFGL